MFDTQLMTRAQYPRMRLLITTQTIDRDDPILGFFHNWVRFLAPHFDHIHVICLKEGAFSLPSNVTVHSLGKEGGANRFKYVYRFTQHLKRLHGEYDIVFSHMNPHYIVLAGLLWKRAHIPILFWRNHARMNWMTQVAAHFARNVFYTSPFACTRIFPHAVQMPVGIDTEIFKPVNVVRNEASVLFLGRLSEVKRPEIFMETSVLLPEYTFVSYGDVPGNNVSYKQMLESRSQGKVTFCGAVKNYETPAIYSSFGIYVNLTAEGSMDKTVLEAAACGAIVLVANTSFASHIPDICILKDITPQGLATHIQKLMSLSMEEKSKIREELRNTVLRQHSLSMLTEKLVEFCYK